MNTEVTEYTANIQSVLFLSCTDFPLPQLITLNILIIEKNHIRPEQLCYSANGITAKYPNPQLTLIPSE